MNYAKALEMARNSLSDEELGKAIDELPEYQKRAELVTMTIPSEMWTPGILKAFAQFAESILREVRESFMDGSTLYLPKDPKELERIVVSSVYYADQERFKEMAAADDEKAWQNSLTASE
jgi:hypothetical protein